MGSAGRWTAAGLLLLVAAAWCIPPALGSGGDAGEQSEGGRGRLLLGFKEARGNASFQCSPSGPCLPCLYSEKNDEKYRCSETGYRVPLKCVEIQDGLKEETTNKMHRRLSSIQGHKINSLQKQLLTTVTTFKWRKLLVNSSTSGKGKQSYITYRSCVPADGEEKLSVLGFEVIMLCLLLISGPMVYIRQKRTATMSGAVRIPTNSPRF